LMHRKLQFVRSLQMLVP